MARKKKRFKYLKPRAAVETLTIPPKIESQLAPTSSHDKRAAWAVNAAIAIYLVFIAWRVLSTVAPAVTLAWYSSSDENVQLAEVIRFANLDFHQQFFDMPGTPLWLLGAVEWRIYYLFAGTLKGFEGGTNLFSFEHLQTLFAMMRVNNLLFFALSGALLFRLALKISNKYAAAAAVTLLMMSGAYDATVMFTRVETMAMCLMLGAILVATESRSPQRWLWAGLLGGLAAACRLHSIAATAPILALLLFSKTWPARRAWRSGFKKLAGALAVALAMGSALAFYGFTFTRARDQSAYPLAYAALAKMSLAVFAGVLLPSVGYFFQKSRGLVERIVTPGLARLCSGLALGALIGTPTIFTQYKQFLKSLDFYQQPAYRDAAAMHLPLAQKITTFLSFYLKTVASDPTTLILLIAGAVLIVGWRRCRNLLPYLIVAAAFFISKPFDLARAPHHIALWIPFYAIVCSAPFALLEWIGERQDAARWAAPAAAVIALVLLRAGITDNPASVRLEIDHHRERTRNIASSRAWIDAHTRPNALFLISFYCFGPDTFYNWLAGLGLQIPNHAKDVQRQVWWGDRNALFGRAGYVCSSPADRPFTKQWDLRIPGDAIDPLHDPHLHLLQSFGSGYYRMDLLDFDYR